MDDGLFRLEWDGPGESLVAIEPTADDVRAHAAALMRAYNEPHNRAMMGHEEMTETDVVEHFAAMRADGARAFLLLDHGELAGDGDLRGIADHAAELAIMIAARQAQGKGLGTRFAIMLHAFAFRALGLERVVVGILPPNVASRRLFEKLGYAVDDSPFARAYADDATDITMSVTRGAFEAAHAAELARITVARR